MLIVLILENHARDAVRVRLRVGRIQEGQGHRSTRLGIVGRVQHIEASASIQIVGEADVAGEIRRAVQRARAVTSVLRQEGVIVNPIRAGLGPAETLGDAVACRFDAVLLPEEVTRRHYACNINVAKVTNASTAGGRCMEQREPFRVDRVFADGPVVVRSLQVSGEDVIRIPRC